MNFILIYCILTAWEVYLFCAQRAALEFGRSRGIPRKVANNMLPLWYLTLWPNKIARWILIYFIFQDFGLLVAIGLSIIPFTANVLIPIPYRHFLPKFEKKTLRLLKIGETAFAMTLYSELQIIREELGMAKNNTQNA